MNSRKTGYALGVIATLVALIWIGILNLLRRSSRNKALR